MSIIVISDLHLGSYNINIPELKTLLKHVLSSPDIHTLIIAGDMYDSLSCNPYCVCSSEPHSDIVEMLNRVRLKKQLIVIKGNHDPQALPKPFNNVLYKDHLEIIYANGTKVFIMHGDVYDNFLYDHPVLTSVADFIYTCVQLVSKGVAGYIKNLSKAYTKNCSQVREKAIKDVLLYGDTTSHAYVICGHTHKAEQHTQDNITYINCGCWTDKINTYVRIDNYGKATLHELWEVPL